MNNTEFIKDLNDLRKKIQQFHDQYHDYIMIESVVYLHYDVDEITEQVFDECPFGENFKVGSVMCSMCPYHYINDKTNHIVKCGGF